MWNLQPTGYDWYSLTLASGESAGENKNKARVAEILDIALDSEYSLKLAGEPGVIFPTASVGTRAKAPATTSSSAVGVRLHLTHLPLLGGHGQANAYLAEAVAPRLSFLGDSNPAWFAELRDYQVHGVSWLARRCGSILADDLGLGKTRTALAAAGFPLLVLCPKTAISIWQDEAEYAGLRCRTLEGSPPCYGDVVAMFDEFRTSTDVWLLNYHVAEKWVRYFCRLGPAKGIHTVIADEAHYLQKPGLKWTETLNGIEKERCILITATPIRNRLQSLWSLLNSACPKAFGSLYDFRRRYCAAVPGDYGLVDGVTSVDDTRRLQSRLSEIVLKRTREDVGHIVPPLERLPFYVSVAAATLNTVLDDSAAAVAHLRGGAGTKVAWYVDLRRRIGVLKAAAAAARVAELLPVWKRAVLWVWHEDVVDALKAELSRLLPDVPGDEILGKTSQKRRNAIARLWKASKGVDVATLEPRWLIASIAAASQAVSFTTCGYANFVEMDWAPLQMVQAEKRTHRFGQIHKKCLTEYSILKNTIDEVIADVLLEKARECETVLGEDGQAAQMAVLQGRSSVVVGTTSTETDEEFMQRIAVRLIQRSSENRGG